ncbi:MAG: hypothetical protein ACREMI_08050 [Gemmatimonadales bacterium]
MRLSLLTMLVQVVVRPPAVTPAQAERLTVDVFNRDDSAIVAVRVTVPEVLDVLGIDAPPGWSATRVAGTDSSAPAIEWSVPNSATGIRRGELRQLAFLVLLKPDARQNTLVVPVVVRHAGGMVRAWRLGGDGPPPLIAIRGSVGVSPRGSFALAAGALGLAVLALGFALRRRS